MFREEREAAAVRALAARGKKLTNARLVVKDELRRAKPEILEALAAGVTTRRIRELTGISLATINRWRTSGSDTDQ